MSAGIMAALAVFAGYAPLHVAVLRAAGAGRVFAPSGALGALGLAACGALAWQWGARGAAWWHALALFGSFWVLHVEAVFILQRSVSIRTVREIAEAPARSLSAGELARRYDPDDALDRRLDTMIAGGYVREAPEGLTLTARGRSMARVFIGFRRLLGIEVYG